MKTQDSPKTLLKPTPAKECVLNALSIKNYFKLPISILIVSLTFPLAELKKSIHPHPKEKKVSSTFIYLYTKNRI